MVIRNKFHAEDPQALGAVVQNLVARANWCPGFVHRWLHTLSSSSLDGCEWLASISDRVNPTKPPFMSHCLGSWWGPEAIRTLRENIAGPRVGIGSSFLICCYRTLVTVSVIRLQGVVSETVIVFALWTSYSLHSVVYEGVVPRPSGSLGEPTMAVVRPILEFPRGQGMNGSGSRKSETTWPSRYPRS